MSVLEGASLENAHAKDVRPWLDLIDNLRQLGVSQDIPLPQIAVMGDQSSGKSSVLEAISGVPFPRGSGLVTRCATQLIMKAGQPGTSWSARASIYAKNSVLRDYGYVEGGPDALTDTISRLQNELTYGNSSAFSSDSIIIEVRAPGLPDLTLIDLPGIVRTAVSGQSASVITEVNSMIDYYLVQDRTIILAVVPANQDVATVDILERAKKVDPEGDRTIGVLTKPDLIGPGNEDEVLAVLRNIRKPLKLGYVMVKCRSQIDINTGMDNKTALATEQKFFRDNSAYAGIPHESLGISSLTKRLTSILVTRIEIALPHIKWELQSQLGQVESELVPMIKGVPADRSACNTTFMKVVSDYCRLLRQSARGYYRDDILSSKSDLRLHTECQVIFRELYHDIAETVPGFNDPGFGQKLANEISSLKGRELPGFLNLQVFYGFMVQNVESWKPPVEKCSAQVASITLSIASLLIQALAIQFPKFCALIRDAVSTIVEQLTDEVSMKVDLLLQKESDPFTANEGMLDVINKIRFKNFDSALEEALFSSGEKPVDAVFLLKNLRESLGSWYMKNHGVGTMANVEDMCTLLQAYWNVATKRLIDNVCMTMEQDFIVKLLNLVESELFLLTTSISDIEELFVEDSSVMEKRRSLQSKKDRLSKGLESLRRMAPEVIAEPPEGYGEASSQAKAFSDITSTKNYEENVKFGSSTIKNDIGIKKLGKEKRESTFSSNIGRKWLGHRWQRTSVIRTKNTQPDHFNMPVRLAPNLENSSISMQYPLSPTDHRTLHSNQNKGNSRVQNEHLPSVQSKVHQDILVSRLMDLGFTGQQAQIALESNGFDPDRAAEWLVTAQSEVSATNSTNRNFARLPMQEPAQQQIGSMQNSASLVSTDFQSNTAVPGLEDFLSMTLKQQEWPIVSQSPEVKQLQKPNSNNEQVFSLFGDDSTTPSSAGRSRRSRTNTSTLFDDTT